LTGKTRLRNDLYCVDGDIKPYSLRHSADIYDQNCIFITPHLGHSSWVMIQQHVLWTGGFVSVSSLV